MIDERYLATKTGWLVNQWALLRQPAGFCVCVLAVTLAVTVSASAQPSPPTLKSATAGVSPSAGGPRSSVVCQYLRCTGTSESSSPISTDLLQSSPALQCDNGLVYNPCGPACSPSCPSVQQRPHSQCDVLSCVEGCFCPAGTVLLGRTKQTIATNVHFAFLFFHFLCICCNMKVDVSSKKKKMLCFLV